MVKSSPEIEAIRKNILSELTELLTKLKKDLFTAKQSIMNEPVQINRLSNEKAANYHAMHVTEEFFLNDIHQKLNDIDIATQIA